jgi:predicted CoA-binding protein
MGKKTVIIGATPNPSRYAYLACRMLLDHGHEVVPVGIKKGTVFGKEIQDLRLRPKIENVDTVTMYIGTRHQSEWADYILSLKPARVIFNPGTENNELIRKLSEAGSDPVEGCTLVMLRSGQY